MDKSVNEILHSMPQFVEAVNQLKKNGRKTEFMYGIANPDEQYTFFKSKNKRGYHSDCPFYAGYYLDGVHGATKCSCLEMLLPGGVFEVQCKNHFVNCPLYLEKQNQKGNI